MYIYTGNKIKILRLFSIAAVRFGLFLVLLFISLVVAIFFLELPHVFVRIFHVVVADILKYLLQVANWLIGYFHQILNIIVLMLFKGMEKHIHHSILVVACFLALRLLTLPILNLKL